MNIGDEVTYNNYCGEPSRGKLTAIGSDKDSYDDIKLKDGVFLYKSKKLKKYVPFKKKSLNSIYLEITRPSSRGIGGCDYIIPDELVELV